MADAAITGFVQLNDFKGVYMNYLFGFLQIVLESLPISSSGHLAIVGLSEPVFLERFVHGPTVLVILAYFWRELWTLLRNWKSDWRKLICWGILIVFANSFTVLVYALLEKFQIGIPLWAGFAITGFSLISLRLHSFICLDVAPRGATQHERENLFF